MAVNDNTFKEHLKHFQKLVAGVIFKYELPDEVTSCEVKEFNSLFKHFTSKKKRTFQKKKIYIMVA